MLFSRLALSEYFSSVPFTGKLCGSMSIVGEIVLSSLSFIEIEFACAKSSRILANFMPAGIVNVDVFMLRTCRIVLPLFRWAVSEYSCAGDSSFHGWSLVEYCPSGMWGFECSTSIWLTSPGSIIVSFIAWNPSSSFSSLSCISGMFLSPIDT